MLSQDPRMNPETANVIGESDIEQPYAKRTIITIFSLLAILIGAGVFIGWYFFGSTNDQSRLESVQTFEPPPVQKPGNAYEEGSGRSAVYNFFYNVFGGIEDGLEDSPHNLKNVEHLDDLNLDTAPSAPAMLSSPKIEKRPDDEIDYRHSIFDVVGSDVIGKSGDKAGSIHDILIHKETGKAKVIIVDVDESKYERDLSAITFRRVLAQKPEGDAMLTVSQDTLERQPDFDYAALGNTNYISLRLLTEGQLIDFEDKVAGQIDAVIYSNAEAQNIYFTLRPVFAQQGISKFQLPFDEINIVENADGYDIKLTKEQTEALAKMLFKE